MYDKPFHRLWQTLTRGKKQFYKEFWALHNISFEVKRGECIGIIGRNGSGKSTLLEIIAGTLSATTGTVEVEGKVAALLELGSGFNHEFTGRENVYMNGALLDLSKEEIDAKFDDILDFADIGSFIDQPLKTYSGGMVLRLAFAVQTQAEPDILIVDEALAVGDMAFQMKCFNHFETLLARGATIILVTHDIHAVQSKCNRAVYLSQGRQILSGDTKLVTERYVRDLFVEENQVRSSATEQEDQSCHSEEYNNSALPICELSDRRHVGNGDATILGAVCVDSRGKASSVLYYGQDYTIIMDFVVKKRLIYPDNFGAGMAFRDLKGMDIIVSTTWDQKFALPGIIEGHTYRLSFTLRNILQPGKYFLVLNLEYVLDNGTKRKYLDFVYEALEVEVVSPSIDIFSRVLPEVEHRFAELRPEAVFYGE
ncbi:MAG: ABC transporter ATP-binding protein [Phycisphaerales bacterium]|nr:MAG: ABC transporter ATP-binding protein [Phycisphaerales bacterium]